MRIHQLQLHRHSFLSAIFLAALSCGKPIEHDPILAGKRAVEFARVAFVRGDMDSSYALLSEGARRYVPLGKFKETVSRLHPKGRPSRVSAVEYEPMPGEKGIYVYLLGRDSGEEFEYTITLEGTASTDYRVSKFTRGHPVSTYVPSSSDKKKFDPPID